MRKTGLLISALVIAVSLTACSGGKGADKEAKAARWPKSTVTIEVAAGAGGGTDNRCRIFTNYLQKATGQAMTVINDATGNGTVAYETVRNAEPDGSTLLFYHSTFPIQYYQGIYDHDPADPENFTVIACVVNGGDGNALCVPADAPYDTLDELMAYCREHPGEITFGNQNGGFGQLEALMLADLADVKINFVDAGGQADTIIAMLGGNIDCTFISPDAGAQYEEAGDMKILGICNEERSPYYPDIPTMVEQGYDVVLKSDMYVFGPSGMDADLVESINQTFRGAADDQDVIKGLANMSDGYTAMSVQESQEGWAKTCEKLKEMCKLAGYEVTGG